MNCKFQQLQPVQPRMKDYGHLPFSTILFDLPPESHQALLKGKVENEVVEASKLAHTRYWSFQWIQHCWSSGTAHSPLCMDMCLEKKRTAVLTGLVESRKEKRDGEGSPSICQNSILSDGSFTILPAGLLGFPSRQHCKEHNESDSIQIAFQVSS